MAYTVRLAGYEGPLDLLLELLAKQELDIAAVAVAQVTAQYLAYLEGLPQEDLELYSEFLVLGATLLALKARLLLPGEKAGPEEPAAATTEDLGASLVERLVQYKRFREAAEALEALAARRARYWDRGPDVAAYRLALEQVDPLAGITLEDLKRALAEVRQREESVPRVSPPRPEVDLASFYRLIRRRLLAQRRVSLADLFAPYLERSRELVFGLLALLILSYRGEVGLEQAELWGPIYVYARALSAEEGGEQG